MNKKVLTTVGKLALVFITGAGAGFVVLAETGFLFTSIMITVFATNFSLEQLFPKRGK